MWCTRWYLPLLLLPFPTAPVYFLVLFILALTLHSQPCTYCISLIAAFFLSSYYWQPVPLSTPLLAPWSTNVTTFGDALLLALPNYAEINSRIYNLTHSATLSNDTTTNSTVQTESELLITLADRGWCPISLDHSMFEPLNTTDWELRTVEQLKADLERHEKEALALADSEADETASAPEVAPEPLPESMMDAEYDHPEQATEEVTVARKKWVDMFMFPALMRSRTELATAPLPEPEQEPLLESTTPPPPHVTPVLIPEHTMPAPSKVEEAPEPLPWLRREYNLKPYGIDAVIDFGWSRTT